MTEPTEGQKHSEEPWILADEPKSGGYFASIKSSEIYVASGCGRTIEEAEANAARIVAAVNFCVGSDLKAELEFGPKTYKEAVGLLRAQVQKAEDAIKEIAEKFEIEARQEKEHSMELTCRQNHDLIATASELQILKQQIGELADKLQDDLDSGWLHNPSKRGELNRKQIVKKLRALVSKPQKDL